MILNPRGLWRHKVTHAPVNTPLPQESEKRKGLDAPSEKSEAGSTVEGVPTDRHLRPRTGPMLRTIGRLRLGLRGRFILYSSMLVVAVVVFIAVILERRQKEFIYAQFEARGIAIARITASLASPAFVSNDRIGLMQIAEQMKDQAGLDYALLLTPEGTVLAVAGPGGQSLAGPLQSVTLPLAPGVTHALKEISYQDPRTGRPTPVLDITVPVLSSENENALRGVVRIGLSLDDMFREIRKTRLRLLGLGEIALALAIAGSYLLGRRISLPIQNLVNATIRAAKGDLLSRIKIQSGDEIGELSRNFNFMVEQILVNQKKIEELNRNLERKVKIRTQELENSNHALKKAFQELKQAESQMIHSEKMASLGLLVAGIAHEINTPTSAINAAADNLRYHMASVGSLIRAIANLPEDSAAQSALQKLLSKATDMTEERRRTSLASVREKSRSLEELFYNRGLGDQRELSFSLARLELEEEMVELLDALSPEHVGMVIPFVKNVATMAASMTDIRVSVGAIIRMVRALKAYSHLEQAEVMDVNIHDGLETTLIILHNQFKYGVEIERAYGNIPLIRGNPSELNQVWTNILLNALQAMKGKGKIMIETRQSDSWVSVLMTDNGPGIPPKILGRIFDPFFTTKDQGEGTGLGLAICQQLVRRNSGKINVSSRPGETCFEVMFPLPQQ